MFPFCCVITKCELPVCTEMTPPFQCPKPSLRKISNTVKYYFHTVNIKDAYQSTNELPCKLAIKSPALHPLQWHIFRKTVMRKLDIQNYTNINKIFI